MLLPIALFCLSLGNTFSFSEESKSKFLYATAFFSGLAVLLQTGAGLVELYKSGHNFIQLLFSKLISGIFGPYGSDLLLSIGKYSTWTRSDLEKTELRGRFWRFSVYCMFYTSQAFNWGVFRDPYSGIFQVRYKSTAIWLAPHRGIGDGYDGLIEEAEKRLENKSNFHYSVKVRNTTMSLRWNKQGLSTGAGRLTQVTVEEKEKGNDSVVEVLLYSSQGNNYGGLFHHQFGPVATQRRYVVELVAMMEILAKDSFVVRHNADNVEGHMLCISFEETMNRVLLKGEILNFAEHTGGSYG